MTEGSVYFAPVVVAAWLVATLPEDVRTVIDLAALAVLLAGIFVVARYRSALSASESAARSMGIEREAAIYKAERLAAENVKLEAKIVELTGRTDVTELATIVASIAETQRETLALLGEIRTAVVPPN